MAILYLAKDPINGCIRGVGGHYKRVGKLKIGGDVSFDLRTLKKCGRLELFRRRWCRGSAICAYPGIKRQ